MRDKESSMAWYNKHKLIFHTVTQILGSVKNAKWETGTESRKWKQALGVLNHQFEINSILEPIDNDNVKILINTVKNKNIIVL